jgi:two-component system, cell cycle sensor histidine kinase and response regulator CckA
MVPDNAIDILWAVSIATAVLLFLAVSIIAVLVYSKRKENAAKIKQQTILDSIDELIYSTEQLSPDSLESYITFVSSRSERGIGIKPDEFAQDTNLWYNMIHPDDRPIVIEQTSAIFKSKKTGLRIYRVLNKKTGIYMWVEDMVFPRLDEKGRVIATFGVIRDITERKVAQEKIVEQAMLLDEAQDAIMVMDFEGRITFWNSGAELLYGWERKNAVGSLLRNVIYDTVHAKEYDLAMEDMFQFNEWNGEQYHLNKKGKELLVFSRWKKVEHASTKKKIILIVNTDITEKRRQEIQVLRAQRMESIAVLTGGIAHDLQNILAPVAMSINLLRDKLTDNPSMKVLDAVEESAKSGIDLVRNIITYGHGVPGERIILELSDLLDSVIAMVQQTMPANIDIERKIENKSAPVLGDANQLKQAFLNIMVNARDAMSNGGSLKIGIERVDVDENFLDKNPDAQTGTYNMIAISDTGEGIPEDRLERIFEPFYTTKSSGNGTGLGLSIALGMVKSHSGFITVQSKERKGTEFRIYLPVYKAKEEKLPMEESLKNVCD